MPDTTNKFFKSFHFVILVAIFYFSCLLKPQKQHETQETREYNYAAYEGGAQIMNSNNVKNARALLNDDNQRYMRFRCQSQEVWIEINLSEDIYVQEIWIDNLEKYSGFVHSFRVMGSIKYPTHK